MVFGEPVYNTEQRRAALAEFKRYIDDLRKKKNLIPIRAALKSKRKRRKRRRNNLARNIIKPYKRRKRNRKINQRGRRQVPITYAMFAAILEDLKRKEKQRKRFLRSLRKKRRKRNLARNIRPYKRRKRKGKINKRGRRIYIKRL